MKSYRLVVRQQGRIVGHFETSGLDGAGKISAWRERCLHHWRLSVRLQVSIRTQDAGEWRNGMKILMREINSPDDLAVVARGLALKCSQLVG